LCADSFVPIVSPLANATANPSSGIHCHHPREIKQLLVRLCQLLEIPTSLVVAKMVTFRGRGTFNLLEVQPVIPVHLTLDWNVMTHRRPRPLDP
jgi:hypothetical protein